MPKRKPCKPRPKGWGEIAEMCMEIDRIMTELAKAGKLVWPPA